MPARLHIERKISRANTLSAVAAGCAVLGLGAWLFYYRAFSGVRGEDWMVFYTAGTRRARGQLSVLYDGDKLTALLNARFVHAWLVSPLPLHPWLYPPHFLLFVVPFATLPPGWALGTFLTLSFAGLAAALWSLGENATERWLTIISALLCPAAAIVACLGQNTFLSCALLVGGFSAMRRHPILGGVLLGMLSYKPQLALMVPVALVAARQWKVLAAAVASAALLAAASAALFGLDLWRVWFAVMTAPSAMTERWDSLARINGQNIYAYAAFLGAPLRLANAAQIAATALTAALVYWFARKPSPDELKLVFVLAATSLSAPHFLGYDAVMLEIAATVFFAVSLRDGPTLPETVGSVLVWLSPLVNPATVFPIGVATPLLILAFLGLVIRHAARAEHRDIGVPALARPA